jgi:ABC-type transport system substrate-binding protein
MTVVSSVVMLVALFIACTTSVAAENVLRFTGISGGAVTIDPHAYVASHNEIATKQVYEALLDIDSDLAIVPQLALAWTPLDPTTWEFELRPDVTFQDGTPFTAGVYLPIRHEVSVFAMRKELDIPPDPWNVPRFRLARFKERTN